jgi:hypothetical protein
MFTGSYVFNIENPFRSIAINFVMDINTIYYSTMCCDMLLTQPKQRKVSNIEWYK